MRWTTHHAAGRARSERFGLAIIAMLGKDEGSTERARGLPHEASVVDVQLDIVLIAKVEEDRPAWLPPGRVREVALSVRVVRMAERWRPVEVIEVLVDPADRRVGHGRTARERAALAAGKRL